jgi:anthranilate synthase component 2
MKILVIDNYDSFTYNLVHALKKFNGVTVEVRRNDEVAEGEPDQYDKIVLSPGPGIPQEAGSVTYITYLRGSAIS